MQHREHDPLKPRLPSQTSARQIDIGPRPLDRLLSIKELRPLIGSPSISTIYRWVASGQFPAPLKIGPNRVAWKVSAIEAWTKSKDCSGTGVSEASRPAS
jgi:prophage regulatory protein